MLKLIHAQMLAIERNTVCTRVLRFIGAACHRDDFKHRSRERARMEALWWALWPVCRHHSEHDLVLAMTVIALAANERIELAGPMLVLQSVVANELRLKNTLAERGYFDFTAFTAFDGGAEG